MGFEYHFFGLLIEGILTIQGPSVQDALITTSQLNDNSLYPKGGLVDDQVNIYDDTIRIYHKGFNSIRYFVSAKMPN